MLDQGRADVAFRAFKAWAELGATDAYNKLGHMYDTGEGTRANRALAIHWYMRAYENGESSSASNLATIYRDSGQAKLEFEWYMRAAQLGDGDSLVEIGMRYLTGKGVRRSLPSARKALRAALRSKSITEASIDTARKLLWAIPRATRDA